METRIFHPEHDTNAVAEAAAILRRGGLLGIPTETVYGLGADALNEDAVRRIFEAKAARRTTPLSSMFPRRTGWSGTAKMCLPPLIGWRRSSGPAR